MQRVIEVYQELEACTDDAARVELLAELSTLFINTDVKRSAEVVDELGKLAARTKSDVAWAYYYSGKGRVCYKTSQFDDAKNEFLKGVEFAKSAGDDNLENNCYHSLGMVYWKEADFERALEVAMKSLQFFERQGHTGNKAMCLNGIGNIHERLGDYAKAEEAYLRGMEILKVGGEERMLLNVMGNLGVLKLRKQEFKNAITYLKPVLQGFNRLKHISGEQQTLVQLGNAFVGFGEYAKGMNYYTKALKLLKQHEFKMIESEALKGLGNIYFHLQGYDDALKHYNRALEIATEIGFHSAVCELYIEYAAVYVAINNVEKANAVIELGLKIAAEKNLKQETNKLLAKKAEIEDLNSKVA